MFIICMFAELFRNVSDWERATLCNSTKAAMLGHCFWLEFLIKHEDCNELVGLGEQPWYAEEENWQHKTEIPFPSQSLGRDLIQMSEQNITRVIIMKWHVPVSNVELSQVEFARRGEKEEGREDL